MIFFSRNRNNKHSSLTFNNRDFSKIGRLGISRFKILDKLVLFSVKYNSSRVGVSTTSYSISSLVITEGKFLMNMRSYVSLRGTIQGTLFFYKLFNLWLRVIIKIIPSGFYCCLSNLFCLDLIFLRRRFFPQIIDNFLGCTIINGSLGFISRYFSKKKNFLRSKASYIMLSGFFRRVIVNIKFSRLRLKIRGLPIFVGSILNCLLVKTNSLYKSPFGRGFIVNEKELNNLDFFNFISVHFMQNKFYGVRKFKRRGRLKRKIRKKVVLSNNILD